jgi:hypothetical protein
MAATPKQLWAAKVFRSAVMPAPLEGSNPATVRITGTWFVGGVAAVVLAP